MTKREKSLRNTNAILAYKYEGLDLRRNASGD